MKNTVPGRIVVSPLVMAGQPVIRGTRLTVHYILGRLAQGATIDNLMQEYDGLLREDIQACLTFAQECLPSAPRGVPGASLRNFAGTLSAEGARQMREAIEEGCEKT